MEADMRSDIFGHYQKLTFAFYDNQKVGALLSRITSDLFDITELLHHGGDMVHVDHKARRCLCDFDQCQYITIVAFVFRASDGSVSCTIIER